MALTKDVLQKFDSIIYKFRASLFKRSDDWKNNPHNISPGETNWAKHDEELTRACENNGVSIQELHINKKEFDDFKRNFKLPSLSLYAMGCKEKKMMEHFIALKLLDIKPNERYVDIASENSPFPNIFRSKLNADVYSQDLTYKDGIHGKCIGSSADSMPVQDNWIDKASLQCAYEHFMGDVDTNFMIELTRVLKPGGKCVIVPLYTADEAINIYDPILFTDWTDDLADENTKIIAEIDLGGHFERIYSPFTIHRIFQSTDKLNFTLYKVLDKESSITDKDPVSVEQVERIRYALLIEKPNK